MIKPLSMIKPMYLVGLARGYTWLKQSDEDNGVAPILQVENACWIEHRLIGKDV